MLRTFYSQLIVILFSLVNHKSNTMQQISAVGSREQLIGYLFIKLFWSAKLVQKKT